MNVSSRCEYACRAALELALHGQRKAPLTATTIAERRSIPEKYLVHILLQLKRAGLVRSLRGAQGGYLIAKPAEAITLHDIVSAIDGPVLDPLPISGAGSDEFIPAWRAVAADMTAAMQSITLQSVIDRAAKAEMYYI